MFKSVPQILRSTKYSLTRVTGSNPFLLTNPNIIYNRNSHIIQSILKRGFASAQHATQPKPGLWKKSTAPKPTPVKESPASPAINTREDLLVKEVNELVHKVSEPFSDYSFLKALVLKLRKQKVTLDEYDCYLFLAILRLNNPRHPLLNNYQNILNEASIIVSEAVSNSSKRQTLYEKNILFKLLVLLGAESSPKNVPVSKEMALLENWIGQQTLDPQFVWDYLSFKYTGVFTTMAPSAVKPEIVDVVKLFVMASKELDFFKDVFTIIQNDNFKVSHVIEKNFLTLLNAISFSIRDRNLDSEAFLPYIHWCMNFFTQVFFVMDINKKLASKIMDIVFSIKELNYKLDVYTYGEIILFSSTEIIKTLNTLTCERFTRIFYLFSRLNFFHFSTSLYNQLIIAIVKYIREKENEFTVEQWKSNLYSMGFNSIWSPEVQRLYDQFLTIDNLESKKSYNRYSVYLKNLLLSALNNFSITNGPQLKTIIDYLVDNVKMHQKHSQYYDLASFIKISIALRRAEYLEENFWKALFDVIPEAMNKCNNIDYDMLFLFKSIELFAKHPESAEKYKRIYSIMQDFSVREPHIYNKIMNLSVKDLAAQLPDTHEAVSSLQHQLKILLEKLNIPFQAEAPIDFMVIDFLLPTKKTVLELQGPMHYLKPDWKKMNMVTKFKNECLRKAGYKVISIPFNSVSTDNVCLDYYIIDHIEGAK